VTITTLEPRYPWLLSICFGDDTGAGVLLGKQHESLLGRQDWQLPDH
jgi:hypothetical protein